MYVALGFKGVPLIVGIKSKIFSLQKEILYERYGITTISIETLNSLLSHSISSIKYFKGKTIAELDSVKLKEKRKQFNLTLRDLADRVGLTKESMHRIEKGKNSSLDVVKKLEKELNSCLIKDFSLKNNFCCEEEKEEELNDPLFEKLMDLGLEVKLFHKTPFNATAKEKQEILVSKANKQDLKRKALNLGQAKKIFNSSSMILTNKCRYQSINSTPVFEGRELDSISSAKDLVKIIKERENRK